MQVTQQIIESKTPPVKTTEQTETQLKDIDTLVHLINQGDGLIVCGRDHYSQDFPDKLMSLASHIQAPVLADPLSNLRYGHHQKSTLIHHYDSIFRSRKAQQLKPDWILRFGSFPVSRSLTDFLSQQDCDCMLVEAHGQNLDPIHTCKQTIQADASNVCQQINNTITIKTQSQLLLSLKSMDEICQQEISIHIKQLHTHLDEAIIIHELLNQLPDDCLLFSGNSMPIRDINSFMSGREHGNKNIELVCNRGASGIDGNLSTFAGHMSHKKHRPAIAMMGDLTFYHDMNGLLKLRELSQQNYNGTVIIINNYGGGIFSYLPQQQLSDFESFWLSSTDLDFKHAADLYSLKFHSVADRQQLSQSLIEALNGKGVNIIEITLQREASVKIHKQLWQRIIHQIDS